MNASTEEAMMAPTSPRTITRDPFCASTPVEALSGGPTANEAFFVRSHFAEPRIDPRNWRLQITGLVQRRATLSLDDLRALPQTEVTSVLECAGNGRNRMQPAVKGLPWDDYAVGLATWRGVAIPDVLRPCGLDDEAIEIVARGADKGQVRKDAAPMQGAGRAPASSGPEVLPYERGLPLTKALDGSVLLALEMNGEPLPPAHGGPVRLVVPGWYGMASVKWIEEIRLAGNPFRGHFQADEYVYVKERTSSSVAPYGVADTGDGTIPVTDMRVRAIVLTPREGERLAGGRDIIVEGIAWSGTGQVPAVRVSVDGGASWMPAALGDALGAYAWRPFRWTWKNPRPGDYTIVAQATDPLGVAQPLEPSHNAKGYGQNAVLPVNVNVAAGP